MVDRQSSVAYAYLNATRIGKLVGVYLGPYAVASGSLEYAPGIFHGEESFIAEHIDILGKPLCCHGREHLGYQHIHIVTTPAGILASYGMRAEKGRLNSRRSRLLDTRYHTEHL